MMECECLFGLSGAGDLVLTLLHERSRNHNRRQTAWCREPLPQITAS